MLARLLGRMSGQPQGEALFVASDAVSTRQDSIDRGLAADAAHMTPARRVGMVAVSVVSLGQSLAQTQNGNPATFFGSVSPTDAFVRNSKP
jgi:hypothetical protein